MKHLFVSLTFSAIAFGGEIIADNDIPKNTWKSLETQMVSGALVNEKLFIGNTVQFDGVAIEPMSNGLRPNPMRMKIYKTENGTLEDTGIVCEVTLKKSEINSVAGYPAATIGVRVLGRVTGVDVREKGVAISSEKSLVVNAD